jgi:uncharacterized surface protein with fasciclin (FAS1) repeats
MKRSLFAVIVLLAAGCQGDDGNRSDSNAVGGKTAAKGEQPKAHLLDALGGSADHKTLANAVKAAGLNETLSGAQPYTLFAPTEAAFGKLAPGTANGLLAPDAKGQLVALLTGHIVPGVVTAADLGKAIDRGKGKAQLATVGGSNLSFAKDGGSIVVTDAAGGRALVTGAERLASNGVVHSVDGVLSGK